MANTTSAKKAERQRARRVVINTSRKSRIKTFISKVEALIAQGNKKEAQEALKAAQSEIMRGVTKNLFTLNTASRKVSRLNAKVKAL